jgi:hypothetical protein
LWLFSLFFLSVLAALVPRHNVVAGILKNVITIKVGILFFKTLLLSLFPTLSRYLMGTQWVLQTFEKVIVVMLCKGGGRGKSGALPYTKASPQALVKFGGGRRATGREACGWRARQDHRLSSSEDPMSVALLHTRYHFTLPPVIAFSHGKAW